MWFVALSGLIHMQFISWLLLATVCSGIYISVAVIMVNSEINFDTLLKDSLEDYLITLYPFENYSQLWGKWTDICVCQCWMAIGTKLVYILCCCFF